MAVVLAVGRKTDESWVHGGGTEEMPVGAEGHLERKRSSPGPAQACPSLYQ